MTRKAHKLTLLFFLLYTLSLAAQQDSCTQMLYAFAKNINTYKNLIGQEKVYLHFDNTGYYVGETIWFKSYVVGAEKHAPSELSKILYVELMSPEGFVVESRKLKIEKGQCHGEFQLKDSLYAGYYEIRAYTAYMLNFGDDCIFSRVFPVYDKPRNEGNYQVKTMRDRPRSNIFGLPSNKAAEKVKLSFFPEGGNLIQGLTSKVAFKAVNVRGENLEVSGSVCNAKGVKVGTFATTHQGSGVFLVTPGENPYSIRIENQSFVLPKAISSGYVLNVNNLQEDSIHVQIAKSADLPNRPVGLTVTCRGKGYLFQALKVTSKEPFNLNIPKEHLPSGVNQITLYDSVGNLLAERMVFIRQPMEKLLSIRTTSPRYGLQPYMPIELNFQLQDSGGLPVETDFSLAVRDEATDDFSGDAGNMMTSLLLSSDLKGYVENPSYYFEANDQLHKEKLDLLMLTQGWSRYSWKKSTGIDMLTLKYPVEKGLTVEGFVKSSPGRELKVEQDVRVVATLQGDTLSWKDSCLTNTAGYFRFPTHDFQGKAHLMLQAKRDKKDRDFIIPLRRIAPPASRAFSYYETTVPKYQIQAIDSLFQSSSIKGRSLPEVTVKAKNRLRYRLDYARPTLTLDFEQEFDKLYDQGIWGNINKQYKEFFPYIELIVDLMHRTGARGEIIYKVNHKGFISRAGDGLDYSNMPPPEKTETIDMYMEMKSRDKGKETDNEDYEVIFSFNAYKNDFSRPKNLPGLRHTTFQGFSYSKEFYSPCYLDKPLPTVKDFRRTLYWNPDVRTDSAGKASVHFYNNGTCKTLKISAETVTDTGITGTFKE